MQVVFTFDFEKKGKGNIVPMMDFFFNLRGSPGSNSRFLIQCLQLTYSTDYNKLRTSHMFLVAVTKLIRPNIMNTKGVFLVAQLVKNPPAMKKTPV